MATNVPIRRKQSRGAARGTIRIGTSGWIYNHWRERFYPKDLPTKRWFAHYARHFDTVEINNSFYRLPSETVFDAWREQAPTCWTTTPAS